MTTDFTPHCPQKDYTVTINLTGTSADLSALYDLLYRTEPENDAERRIKDDVLHELRAAHYWLTDMEDIAKRIKTSETIKKEL